MRDGAVAGAASSLKQKPQPLAPNRGQISSLSCSQPSTPPRNLEHHVHTLRLAFEGLPRAPQPLF